MKIVIIDKKDALLRFENNTIKIDQQSVPFKYLDLLILNHKINLVTGDILKLNKEGICVLIVSHANDNLSLIRSANTKNGEIKIAQYYSNSRNIEFARYFIYHKILAHTEQLFQNEIHISCTSELQQLSQANSLDEIMGIEGSFARKYFQEYFTLCSPQFHKSKRSKQPPLDPLNAVLSFWYSLYHHIITVKLLSHGFEPALGYLHTPFRTHDALSSDLLELFRAQINEAVIQLFKNEILELSDFSKKGGVYLKFEGRKKIWSYFVALQETLKPQLDREVANLKRMIYDEKNTDTQ